MASSPNIGCSFPTLQRTYANLPFSSPVLAMSCETRPCGTTVGALSAPSVEGAITPVISSRSVNGRWETRPFYRRVDSSSNTPVQSFLVVRTVYPTTHATSSSVSLTHSPSRVSERGTFRRRSTALHGRCSVRESDFQRHASGPPRTRSWFSSISESFAAAAFGRLWGTPAANDESEDSSGSISGSGNRRNTSRAGRTATRALLPVVTQSDGLHQQRPLRSYQGFTRQEPQSASLGAISSRPLSTTLLSESSLNPVVYEQTHPMSGTGGGVVLGRQECLVNSSRIIRGVDDISLQSSFLGHGLDRSQDIRRTVTCVPNERSRYRRTMDARQDISNLLCSDLRTNDRLHVSSGSLMRLSNSRSSFPRTSVQRPLGARTTGVLYHETQDGQGNLSRRPRYASSAPRLWFAMEGSSASASETSRTVAGRRMLRHLNSGTVGSHATVNGRSVSSVRRSNVAPLFSGIPSQIFQLLPTEQYTSEKRPTSGNACSVCAICHMEYATLESLRRLPCFHVFHDECIGRWLQSQRSCPVCRLCILKTLEQSDLGIEQRQLVVSYLRVVQRMEESVPDQQQYQQQGPELVSWRRIPPTSRGSVVPLRENGSRTIQTAIRDHESAHIVEPARETCLLRRYHVLYDRAMGSTQRQTEDVDHISVEACGDDTTSNSSGFVISNCMSNEFEGPPMVEPAELEMGYAVTTLGGHMGVEDSTIEAVGADGPQNSCPEEELQNTVVNPITRERAAEGCEENAMELRASSGHRAFYESTTEVLPRAATITSRTPAIRVTNTAVTCTVSNEAKRPDTLGTKEDENMAEVQSDKEFDVVSCQSTSALSSEESSTNSLLQCRCSATGLSCRVNEIKNNPRETAVPAEDDGRSRKVRGYQHEDKMFDERPFRYANMARTRMNVALALKFKSNSSAIRNSSLETTVLDIAGLSANVNNGVTSNMEFVFSESISTMRLIHIMVAETRILLLYKNGTMGPLCSAESFSRGQMSHTSSKIDEALQAALLERFQRKLGPQSVEQ